MKKIKIAAILLFIHGLIEVFALFGPIAASFSEGIDIEQYMQFILPAFQANVILLTYASSIYGVLRIIAAIGLIKNRYWGFILSLICSVITLTLMMFVLPAGIMDGILSGAVIVLLLLAYFDNRKIVEN